MNKEKRSPKTMTEIKQTMYVMTLKVEAQHLLHKDHANRFKYESYNGLILTKRQNNMKIFLIAAVVLNLAG